MEERKRKEIEGREEAGRRIIGSEDVERETKRRGGMTAIVAVVAVGVINARRGMMALPAASAKDSLVVVHRRLLQAHRGPRAQAPPRILPRTLRLTIIRRMQHHITRRMHRLRLRLRPRHLPGLAVLHAQALRHILPPMLRLTITRRTQHHITRRMHRLRLRHPPGLVALRVHRDQALQAHRVDEARVITIMHLTLRPVMVAKDTAAEEKDGAVKVDLVVHQMIFIRGKGVEKERASLPEPCRIKV